MARWLLGWLVLGGVLGCGGAQGRAPASRPAVDPRSEPVQRAPEGRTSLTDEAAFTELVRVAIAHEGQPPSGAGCLLARQERRYLLRAELASALRPLPLPPASLIEPLRRAQHVEILSAWGRYGDGTGTLSLAGFTAATPTRAAAAVILSARGASLRGPSGDPLAPIDARSFDELLTRLDPDPSRTLFVTAEAGVPLGQVVRALEALAERGLPVALAVALAADTLLPPPASATARVAYCPTGLPETDAAEGSLSVDALRAGIAPLQSQASTCVTRGDARGAAGGRLSLGLRVDAAGRVTNACVTEDKLGDPGVLVCVLDLARKLSFAPPAPSGVIDVGLPIVLLPSGGPGQRPLCREPRRDAQSDAHD
ncbi:MAG: hypothetical protein ABW252_01080 [Polyangiales bacterium]